MIYNLYELAEIYNVSRQHIQERFREFRKQVQERTGKLLLTARKDNRTALQSPEIEEFIDYCGYDYSTLHFYDTEQGKESKGEERQGNDKQGKATKGKARQVEESIGNEGFFYEQIDFLKRQLEAKDDLLAQQNQLLAMTQANLNTLIKNYEQLQIESVKRAQLISSYKNQAEAIIKLEAAIEKARSNKIAENLKKGIEISEKLLKEKRNGQCDRTY